MSNFDKRYEKFNKKLIVEPGSCHMKIIYKEFGSVIPIPRHGKTVEEAYIKELKKLFARIKEEKEERDI